MLGVLPSRPTLGVRPAVSLSPPPAGPGGPPAGADRLTVAAIRLPRTSNSTDVDALGAEPGVTVRWTASPAEVAAADLAVLPGSRATVADLAWLREQGLAAALIERAGQGRPVLGICGGYQMLARTIVDDVESGAGTVPGLGLLPVTVRFQHDKILDRPTGEAFGAPVSTGYEIHHGRTTLLPDSSASDGAGASNAGPSNAGSSNAELCEPFLDGYRVGPVWGTMWHGAFDSDEFRRRFLTRIAAVTGRDFTAAPGTDIAAGRARQLDRLADAVEAGLDIEALTDLITAGPPSGLPFLPPGAPKP